MSMPARFRLGLGLAALELASCASQPRVVAVSVEALESAAEVGPILTERSIITDADALQSFYVALGPRMGLVQVHNGADWDRLREVAPEIGDCPNLARGSVIGIVCRTGTPLDGDWPIELNAVRITDGAGFVCASFHGGSYLPDGAAFLEATYVEGLNSVLMVDVNGVRFYTE